MLLSDGRRERSRQCRNIRDLVNGGRGQSVTRNNFFTAGTYGNSESELTSHVSFWQKYIQLGLYYDVLRPAVSGASNVCVYGLSFSKVDFPYLQWIVEKNPNLKWRVSWHSENDKKCISEILRTLGAVSELFYM